MKQQKKDLKLQFDWTSRITMRVF